MKLHVINKMIYPQCPSCGTITPGQITEHSHQYLYNCPACKTITTCELCFRQYHRKKCNITGHVYYKELTFQCVILDMSVTGYRIRLMKRPLIDFQLNDKAIIKFTLPTKLKTEINDTVEFINQNGLMFGLQIVDMHPYSSQHRDKGFWING